MTRIKFIKRLVILVLILRVTSHRPLSSNGNRLITSTNDDNDDNDDPQQQQQQQLLLVQSNEEPGSYSSLGEISFQPLTKSANSFWPESLQSSQYKSKQPHPIRDGIQQFRQNQLRLFDDDPQRHSSSVDSLPLGNSQRRSTSSVRSANGFFAGNYNDVDGDDFQLLQHPENARLKPDNDNLMHYSWNAINKRQSSRIQSGSRQGFFYGSKKKSEISQPEESRFPFVVSAADDDAYAKRSALVAFKRQKGKHQTQFIPSISVGAMTNLGDFFNDLKNNVEFMEKARLSDAEQKLLEGDHPISMLRDELLTNPDRDSTKPTGTAAFLHAIRTYRPSQKIRSLVSMNPEGYHGSQFLDPNYMWVGLGK